MATTVRDIGFRLGYDVDKQSEAAVENSIKTLKNTAAKLLGAIGIGFSLTKINELTEEFRTVNRAIKSAVDGLDDVDAAERSILEAANESRTTYESMANTVSNLVKSNSELFPVQDAVDFSSSVTKLLKTAGRSDGQIQSMMNGLNKSFQKGAVDTETLNVMLEQCPEAANLLADSLGVAKTSLLDMATNGQISCKQLKDAFLDSADEIGTAFDSMDLSITEAITSVKNSWGYLLSDLDRTYGITDKIARTIVKVSNMVIAAIEKIRTRIDWVAEKLGGVNNILKLFGVIAGSVFGVIALGKAIKLLAALQEMDKTMLKQKLKLVALAAVFIVLALLIEDFFAFMKGENSLIGTMLEKAGVDTDAFRQSCKELWKQVKDIIDVIKQFGKALGRQLLDALKQILSLLGKLIASILPVILQVLQKIVSFIGRLAETVLPMIVSMVERLLPFLVQIIESILPVIINLVETLLPLFMQIIDAVLPIIISLIETLLPLVIQIIEAVLPVILQLIEAIVPILVQIIEAILPVVLELISALLPIIEPIITIVASLVQSLLPVLVSLLEAILPILEPILDILQPIADILGVIIGAIAKVVGWVADGLGWVVDKILGDDGDTSNADKVNAYAKGTDNSSDTFIAGEEGAELVTGAAGRKVFTALETGKIFQAMAMLGRAATAKPSTITNSSSSRVVNQYNEFVNTFHGDRAGQSKSAEAMSSASDDAVSTMARALSFAR